MTDLASRKEQGLLQVRRNFLRLPGGSLLGLLILRLLLAILLFLQAIPHHRWFSWIETLPVLYAVSATLFYWLRRTDQLSETLGPATFMVDVAVSLTVLWATAGNQGETYTVVLLLIVGSCLLQRPALVLTISAVVCFGGTLLTNYQADFLGTFLLRQALFVLIVLFSIHIADYVASIERQTAKSYEERLAWMQRLSITGKAMASVLHEAKTPLGTIVLNAESVLSMLREGKDPSKELSVISEEAEHATAVLQNFLDFVKPAPLDLKPLRAGEPLSRAVQMARVRLDEREVELDFKTINNDGVLGSFRHLVQASTNLINNAVNAMPSGGKLTIRMVRRGGMLEIHFDDTGVGLGREDLEHIFEPFNAAKPTAQGNGLGLGIVRWIAQEHGGDVEIDSQGPGKGCRATLLLPAAKS